MMHYQAAPYAAWDSDWMEDFLAEKINTISVTEGIWLTEEAFYAALFFLDIPSIRHPSTGDIWFIYLDRTFYCGSA